MCDCESLISKWLCERSRFRTVLKSGSGLSVAALWRRPSALRAGCSSRGGCAVSTDDEKRLPPLRVEVKGKVGIVREPTAGEYKSPL